MKTEAPEDRFVDDLRANPIERYLEIRHRALEARARGEPTFSFDPEQRPVLLLMLEDLERRIAAGDDLATFEALRAEALELLEKKLPYVPYLRFGRSYIKAVDRFLRARNPKLSGDYNEDLAGWELEPILAKAPDAVLFYTWKKLPPRYFLDSRPVPMYVLALGLEEEEFIDGFPLTPKEVMFHDLGHSGFMERRDAWLFDEAGAPIETLIRGWRATKEAILAALKEKRKSDRDLAVAANLLLFEVIHERGYQFYLPFLRQQLETTKWAEVIRKKIRNDYFAKSPMTAAQVARLEDARLWALARVKELAAREVAEAAAALDARTSPVTIKVWHPVATYRGAPLGMEIVEHGQIRVEFELDGGGSPARDRLSTSLYEVALAQVQLDYARPLLGAGTRAAIAQVMDIKKARRTLRLGDGCAREYVVEAIHIDPAARVLLTLRADGAARASVPLAEVVLPSVLAAEVPPLGPVEAFKMEQILALQARQGRTELTVTPPPDVFEGTVLDIRDGRIWFSAAGGGNPDVRDHELSFVSIQSRR